MSPTRSGAEPAGPGDAGAAARLMRDALTQVSARFDGAADGDRAGRYRALCAAAAATLPVRGASLSLMEADGGATLLAFSDELSERVAELQFTTGDGPTGEVLQIGAPILEPELGHNGQWPLFAPAALELGVRSIFVFPLQIGAIRMGALCLDHDKPGPLSRSQQSAASTLTRAVVAAVLTDLGDAPSPDGWITEVDGYHAEVHHATGMVLVQLGTTAEGALLRLRAHAFTTGRPIVDVAADVVARRLSFRGNE